MMNISSRGLLSRERHLSQELSQMVQGGLERCPGVSRVTWEHIWGVLRIGRSSQKRIRKTKEHSRVFCPVVDFPQKTNDVIPWFIFQRWQGLNEWFWVLWKNGNYRRKSISAMIVSWTGLFKSAFSAEMNVASFSTSILIVWSFTQFCQYCHWGANLSTAFSCSFLHSTLLVLPGCTKKRLKAKAKRTWNSCTVNCDKWIYQKGRISYTIWKHLYWKHFWRLQPTLCTLPFWSVICVPAVDFLLILLIFFSMQVIWK